MNLPIFYDVDISKPLLPTPLQTMLVTADALANRIGVRLYEGNEPYSPGGSCAGFAVRRDGMTVPITGTISGNEMYIDLPAAAYALEGPINIGIKNVLGSQETTVFLGLGTVVRGETGVVVDPGTIIPSVSALIEEIESAIASIPADYSALLASIAPTFNASNNYVIGNYVWYDGNLCRFSADHPAGPWIGTDASHYTATDEYALLRANLNTATANLTADIATRAPQTMIASTFSPSANYTAGSYVIYSGNLYRFNADHPAGAWIGTDAARYTATDEFPLIRQALGTKADAADVAELKSAITNVESSIYTTSDNLFDFDKIIANKTPGSVGSDKDAMVALNGWYTSNYIPVIAGTQYALILNGNITTGAVFRVACYKNGVMTYRSSANESNPYTVPADVDHIRFYSNTANLFNNRTNTSFKKYSSDMSKAWTPYGYLDNFLVKGSLPEYGVYVDGTNYYHFVNFGEKTLIRVFKQEGPNNLFQFSALYVGEVSQYGVSINETIATNGTDTVGPISIMRQDVDSGGMWSGGWHTRTVNNVACPTAKQDSLDIRINGESIIGSNGLHYGECIVTVVNSLYFPQTITGSDLSEATRAIEETVQYMLSDTMKARVSHKYVADTRVIRYYGLQAIRIGFDSILLPDNETSLVFNDMSADYLLEKSENLMQMRNSAWNYDLILMPYGLAKLTHNPGTGQTKYGSIPTSTRKVYWVLIEGSYDYTFITAGKVLAWEGEWHIYPN